MVDVLGGECALPVAHGARILQATTQTLYSESGDRTTKSCVRMLAGASRQWNAKKIVPGTRSLILARVTVRAGSGSRRGAVEHVERNSVCRVDLDTPPARAGDLAAPRHRAEW
jgi:hypothetical protein